MVIGGDPAFTLSRPQFRVKFLAPHMLACSPVSYTHLDVYKRQATPGGGCQFLGTAATSQVVGEALGMALALSLIHI